jgi:hypothetical protein
MGLRTAEGIARPKEITTKITALIKGGFLTHANQQLQATPQWRLALQVVLRNKITIFAKPITERPLYLLVLLS